MKIKFRRFTFGFLAVLILLSALPTAFAANGSLSMTVTDENDEPVSGFEVRLCKVAGSDGVLFSEFAASGITAQSLLDERNTAKNAKKLLAYTDGVAAEVRNTDAEGDALFNDLSRGIYLVYAPEQQGYVFEPFLLYMPTMINGEPHYGVVSAPKVAPENQPGPNPPGGGGSPTPDPDPDEPIGPEPTDTPDPDPTDTPTAEPTAPVDPTPTPTPVLPLTGVERRPIWVLLGLGSALIIAGALQLCLRREKHE